MAAPAVPACGDTSLRLRLWTTSGPACRGPEAAPRACFTVVFVDAGHGRVVLDGTPVALAPGDVCWAAPGQVLELAVAPEAAWWLAFDARAVDPHEAEPVLLAGPPRQPWLVPFARAVQHGPGHTALPAALHAGWRTSLARIAHEQTSQPTGHASAVRALLGLLLLDLSRHVARDVATPAQDDAPRARSALVDAVLRFIEEHYRRPIGLRDVARAVDRSPAYLTDRVRRETGRPIVAWLTERRMAEARRLLRSSALSTEQVAAESGFGDPRHFARQFRRLNGLPPQAWRAAQRLEPREPRDSAMSAMPVMSATGPRLPTRSARSATRSKEPPRRAKSPSL